MAERRGGLAPVCSLTLDGKDAAEMPILEGCPGNAKARRMWGGLAIEWGPTLPRDQEEKRAGLATQQP